VQPNLSLRLFPKLSHSPSLPSQSRLTLKRVPDGTCHVRRSVLIVVAPDPQLAFPVVAPALDPASGGNRARVRPPRCYGDEGEACEGLCRCVRRGGLQGAVR
jgi:hypothetical protein